MILRTTYGDAVMKRYFDVFILSAIILIVIIFSGCARPPVPFEKGDAKFMVIPL